MSHLRGDARKRATGGGNSITMERLEASLRWHFNCHAAEPDRSYASLGIANACNIVGLMLTEARAAVLTAAADDLNQHAHTYADTLTPTDYAAADIALRQIGINLSHIIAAAWHLALLDAAGRVRETAIHKGAR